MNLINHQFRLVARPVGLPKSSDWQITEDPVREPHEGEVLVKVLYLSLYPAMRGWMNEGKSYIAPVALGDVMRAGAVGRVIASGDGKFAVGDHVSGAFGVQEYAHVSGRDLARIDPNIAPLPVYLGTLGMPGFTGYFRLLEIGKPQPGQTVVVSGAAGADGFVLGEIAKIKGCRRVRLAGGRPK